MPFLNSIFSSHKKTLWLLLVAAVLNLCIFAAWFGFHENNDTDTYIIAINFFRGDPGGEMWPYRYLNPFYSVVGSTIFDFLTPAQSIVVSNICFYFGLVFVSYGLFRRVLGSNRVAFIAVTCLITGYPMLRYALTQVEDIGAYFWFVLTLYSAWRWYEDKSYAWLLLGSVAISGGLLTKESGAMGALFFGIIILWNRSPLKHKILQLAVVSSLAALTLGINIIRGIEVNYSSAQWFVGNWQANAATNYNLTRWVGVNATTYNLLWIPIMVGAYLLVTRKVTCTPAMKLYAIAVLLPSLSYFAWPLFIGRTVFISAWLLIPLGALAIDYWLERKPIVGLSVWAATLFTPYVLQETVRYAHLFQIYESCGRSWACTWRYFWENRSTFSTKL